jgi:hypothetical protein
LLLSAFYLLFRFCFISVAFEMDDGTGPILIAVGIPSSDAKSDPSYELRRRGFIIKHKNKYQNECNFVLSMSKRLVAKLATENGLAIQPIHCYTQFAQVILASQAAQVILRATAAIGAKDCWIAHDESFEDVAKYFNGLFITDTAGTLTAINNYFGPQVALYFSFLDFYTKNLLPVTVGGSMLFLHQFFYQSVDSVWLPVFCFVTSLWSTYFLESWKRRCAVLAYGWGVYGTEDKELIAELAKVGIVCNRLVLCVAAGV